MSTRPVAQIANRMSNFLTVNNTVYLYPQSDIDIALANTSYTYTFDGTNIVCPDLTNLYGVYGDIINQTLITQPIGNQGYSLGVGTSLQDLGKEIQFVLSGGEIVLKWRLVKQLTPQVPYTYIPVPGNSPADTVGYVTVFTSYSVKPFDFADIVLVVRTG